MTFEHLVPNGVHISFRGYTVDGKWISLNNGGDRLWLKSKDSTVVDSISYTDVASRWAGISWERINTAYSGTSISNWRYCRLEAGHSAGRAGDYNRAQLRSVVINELAIDPLSGDEWIELYNSSSDSAYITRWRISTQAGDTTTVVAASGSKYIHLPPREYVVLARRQATLDSLNIPLRRQLLMSDGNISLSNVTDRLILIGRGGESVDSVFYDSRATHWRESTWERINPAVSGMDPANWGAPDNAGSPGARNSAHSAPPVTYMSVVINELVSKPQVGAEWFELYNTTGDSIGISRWSVIKPNNACGYLSSRIAGRPPSIPPNGYAVVCKDSVTLDSLGIPPENQVLLSGNFPLNDNGDNFTLLGRYGEAVDSVSYGSRAGAFPGHSWERIEPLRSGRETDNWSYSNLFGSPGRKNSATTPPAILPGSLVINEIYPAPINMTEWLELYNTSLDDLPITRWSIRDADSNEVQLVKDDGSVSFAITEGSYLVVCDDPATLDKLNIPSEQRVRFGSGSLTLNNDADTLYLYAGDMLVDSICYDKLASNKPGYSWERITPYNDGMNPGCWQYSLWGGSPGKHNYVFSPSVIYAPRLELAVRPTPYSSTQDEALEINVELPDLEGKITLEIYDLNGFRFRTVATNALVVNRTGSFFWDGKTDSGRRVPVGRYILFGKASGTGGQSWESKVIIVVGQ